MSIFRTVFEIFSINEWRDLETDGRGQRLLKMASFGRLQCIYDFLLVGHYKYSCMLYHFRVIWRWIIVTVKFGLQVT